MAENKKITIATTNPFVTEINDKFITFLHNPENATVTQPSLSKMEKVQGGYIKVGFPLGLVTIQFSGRVPLYFKDELGNKYYPTQNINVDIATSPVYQWFAKFKYFINQNVEYPFLLQWDGYVAELGVDNPVLKGDCSTPDYSTSADDPNQLDYSFQFDGTITNAKKDVSISNAVTQEIETDKAIDNLSAALENSLV